LSSPEVGNTASCRACELCVGWRTLKASGLLFSVLVCLLTGSAEARAQVRGVYPLGMSATNSGVTPESGFSYANQLLFYSRNELKGPRGELIATGRQSVLMDMNSFIWVSKAELLGGARLSASATLPIANNSLTSDVDGPMSGGQGFADSYYQPVILGWGTKRADFRVVYGFLAPTGRFNVGADNNVGSGYWTHAVSSGQTFYLTKDKATSASAFQMYEFHTTQKVTHIHPGQTLSLDYAVTHTLPVQAVSLQVGLVGYNQFQTTDKSGPGISSEQGSAHYRVNALGFTSNVMIPSWKANLGFKYFKEFSSRSTFEGYSAQVSGSIRF
jgi:hypothetical protein